MLIIFIRYLCLWPFEFIVFSSIVIHASRMLYPVKICNKWICDIDLDQLDCAMLFFLIFFYIHIATFFYFQLYTLYRRCEIPINEENAKNQCARKKNKFITFRFITNHKDKKWKPHNIFFSNVRSAMIKKKINQWCPKIERAQNVNSTWLLCLI